MKKAYRPSDLHALLKTYETSAKKRYSQNFLIDYNILKKIIKTADIQQDDIVLEIGAGPGALTEALLEQGARVIAIELDSKLVQILKRLQENNNRLKIIEANILKLPFDDNLLSKLFFEQQAHPDKNFAKMTQYKKIKIVANLPYHITTPILTRFLPFHKNIDSLTVMVQKEFAERMAAPVGTSAYSSFTLFLQFYSDVKLCFVIKPSCFYPVPKVQSAVVNCILHKPELEEKYITAFFKLTRRVFQQRRKMLRTTLKALYSVESIDNAIKHMHLNPKVRPEELSLSQFLSLFRSLEV